MKKSKTKKIILTAVAVVLTLSVALGAAAYFLLLHRYKGTEKIYEWHATDVFDISSIATVEKEKDKDFVILNLADVQTCDLDDIPNYRTIKKELDHLVDTVKPDLITLTGDQTWSNENLISLKTLIRWLDGYKIPYAPIFGNHDHGNEFSSAVAGINKCCDLYEKGKYSLFRRGPTNIGALGNYVVNITEEGKIVKTLYMMDAGYLDEINDGQIDWFLWNADGIKAANGGEYSEGICFFHKPLPEYYYAFRDYYYGKDTVEALGEVHVHFSLGGTTQKGFFDKAKERGVKDVICGHQHGNNFTIKYEGVRLTFALKTGELVSYYADENVYLNGATAIRLRGTETIVENHYVPRDRFHIKGSHNVYEE